MLDVHEYLDMALIEMATSSVINFSEEKEVFKKTFSLLKAVMGEDSFKRWDGNKFLGMFLLSVYEVMAIGISHNIVAIESMSGGDQAAFVLTQAKALWDQPIFQKNSGAGVRGTTRLANLLPMAADFFKP